MWLLAQSDIYHVTCVITLIMAQFVILMFFLDRLKRSVSPCNSVTKGILVYNTSEYTIKTFL